MICQCLGKVTVLTGAAWKILFMITRIFAVLLWLSIGRFGRNPSCHRGRLNQSCRKRHGRLGIYDRIVSGYPSTYGIWPVQSGVAILFMNQ